MNQNQHRKIVQTADDIGTLAGGNEGETADERDTMPGFEKYHDEMFYDPVHAAQMGEVMATTKVREGDLSMLIKARQDSASDMVRAQALHEQRRQDRIQQENKVFSLQVTLILKYNERPS